MKPSQTRLLYREFLFRIVDLELLSAHAEGDSRTLLGQFASLLIYFSGILALAAIFWATTFRGGELPPIIHIIGAWTVEHFLIATTMLVVGVFAVLSWESTFPNRHDMLVLGPLPLRGSTIFVAKLAAVASALGLTLASLHLLAGIAWPLALVEYDSTPAPALAFDNAMPPVDAVHFPDVMNRDMAPMLRRLDLAAADGGAGIVIGVSTHGVRRIMTYGTARRDSLFEIGSITKTFTGLLLARMAVAGQLDLGDPVRELLPPGSAPVPKGFEITLADLATHHSGLPVMPDNAGRADRPESYTGYRTSDLYDFLKHHGLGKTTQTSFVYSNLGFAVLGAALANRAAMPYPELLRSRITGPLGMHDTVIALSPEQRARFLSGYDEHGRRAAPFDLDAFASAGGIRSTADDLLTYLEAQLHPDTSPFPAAIKLGQRLREYVAGDVRIGLAWMYDPHTGNYEHNGSTGGFSSDVFFNPAHDYAAVVLMNGRPPALPAYAFLSGHVQQRLAGEPAFSLTPVSVPPAGLLRSFLAYWITMLAAGTFVFCCVLALQGFTAQILPRRWFLRLSGFLQLALFCLLVTGYFMQRSPIAVLVTGPRPWLSWIPSYWFVGMYQQLSGSLHPALAPFARRAWLGLFAAIVATGAAYAASYVRALHKIVEEPDIAPAFRHSWLPHLGGPFATAIVQFSMRSLFRSRQHRMIFAFYLGIGFAFAILFLNAPAGISGPPVSDPLDALAIPLLVSTITVMGFWVAGARVVFSLPLDLQANWIFRAVPVPGGAACLKARRLALLILAVGPPWLLSAAVLFARWPWRPAAAHLAVLALLGIVLAEFSFDGVLKIPFTCSYLPGRSNLHVTFWLWLYVMMLGIVGAAISERKALDHPAAMAAVLVVLGAVALAVVIRNQQLARPSVAEIRFEEIPPGKLVSLELS